MKPLEPRLVARSRTVRWHLVTSVGLGMATAVLIIAVSWLIADAVARRFEGQPVLAIPVAIAVAFGLRAAISWGHAVISERAAVRVKAELRNEVVQDLLDPRRQGSRPSSSRLMTLLGPGLDAFDGYVGRFLPQLGLAVVVPPVVIVVIAWVDLLSAVTIILTMPLIGLFMVLIGTLTRDRVERRWQAMERLGRHFADVLDGLVVLRVFGRRQEEGLRHIGVRHRNESMKALRLAFLSSLVLELFSTIAVALVAVSIGLRMLEGQVGLQDAMFVLLLAPEAYLPVRRVGMLFHDSTEGATATIEVLDLLDHPRHRGSQPVPAGPLNIAINDVTVRHAGRTQPALQVENEHIAAGEFVALTGPSGAGKSTLLAVLLGMQAPDSGDISVNGVPLSEIDVTKWRERVAWVPQVPAILAGTVADNVTMGAAETDRADTNRHVRRALTFAGLTMPAERQLTENGGNISAGERRRIGIARAIYAVNVKKAELLVADEPTAGLDQEIEIEILASLSELSITMIVVAHRAETIAAADRVISLGQVMSR